MAFNYRHMFSIQNKKKWGSLYIFLAIFICLVYTVVIICFEVLTECDYFMIEPSLGQICDATVFNLGDIVLAKGVNGFLVTVDGFEWDDRDWAGENYYSVLTNNNSVYLTLDGNYRFKVIPFSNEQLYQDISALNYPKLLKGRTCHNCALNSGYWGTVNVYKLSVGLIQGVLIIVSIIVLIIALFRLFSNMKERVDTVWTITYGESDDLLEGKLKMGKPDISNDLELA